MSRRKERSDDGAAALEFALVVPILALLLFGIISYGYMFSVRQAISQAAAEGARAAAVTQPGGDTSTAATKAVNNALDGFGLKCGQGGLTCTPTAPAACNGDAQCVSMTVSYAYKANEPFHIPLVPLPDALSFKSTAEINQ